ncbi:ABC transporter permease [Actinomadura barringtoniae]|uniref:ABC transporter permease n=1 Tax=Actinomadura barringtoniae TaxID=1427535 RepID=A0A939PJ63_9ACTN|nr:ABC transporter permease [Actinomadura barringtoniae]MBO2453257.1 ABC transporter permease [Actinomadura barringtoniae]
MRHDRVRFGLTAALVGLVAFLVFMLTGLATGLGQAGVSGLGKLPADTIVFSSGADKVLSRSALPASTEAKLRADPAVRDVRPIGQSMVQTQGTSLALIGLDPVPPGTIVLDRSVHNVKPGDVLTIDHTHLKVSLADLGSIQHTPVGRVSLSTWQHLEGRNASAYLLHGKPRPIPGAEMATKSAAIDAVPGYKAETGTVTLIRGFLLAVTALLIGTVFWIFTLQKEPSLAVLRATGARARLLVGSYLVQVILTTVTGVALGFAVVQGIGATMPAGTFSLTATSAAAAAAILSALAIAASAASLRRLLTIDPLLSLGRNA